MTVEQTAAQTWGEYEDLLLEQRDGVLVVTLNQPDKLNALSGGMRASLRRLVGELPSRDDVRALVITGAGRGFCSGADLSPGAGPAYREREGRSGRLEPNYAWLDRLRQLDIPVIAAINGAAAGAGMAIACACDLRVMDAGAKLHPAFVRRGLGPDNGLSWTLPRLAGPSRALLLLWTGDPVSADEAFRMGIVEQVAPEGQALEWAVALASRLAGGPALAIALTKRAVHRSAQQEFLSQGEWEQAAQEILRQTEDAVEGRTAFREGRQPRFTGR